MSKMHNEFNDFFSGIGCFEGKFSLQVQDDNQSFQVSLRWKVYAFNEPVNKELE